MKDIKDILKNTGFKDSEYINTFVKDYGDGLKIYAGWWPDPDWPDVYGRREVSLRMNLDSKVMLNINGPVTNEEELAALVKDCCEKFWQKLEKKRKRIEEAQLKTAGLLLSGV